MHDVTMVIHFYLAGRLYWLLGISALKLGEKCNMDILARFVDKEEKILVKLIIVSAHVLERISQVANTASLIFTVSEIAISFLSKLLRPALCGQPLLIEVIGTSIEHLLFKVLYSSRIAELQARALKGVLSPLSTCPSNQVLDKMKLSLQ